MTNPDPIKTFYTDFHDKIYDKRFNSPYWTRQYAHRQIHAQFLPYIQKDQTVLDVGCGEGILSSMVAKQGAKTIGSEISAPNLQGAQEVSDNWGVQVTYLQADAENIPFPSNSFDVVLSSHVLEHLPNIEKGLQELYRVTKSKALIAMPTCLNPACWIILGGENYYVPNRRSALAFPLGIARTVQAFIQGKEGPDEGYAGSDVPHVWRFPWIMKRLIRQAGFTIEKFEAGPLIVPFIAEKSKAYQRFQQKLDSLRDKPVIQNFGYGSMAVCRKN